MTSYEGYELLSTPSFERSYRDLRRKHYKKDQRGSDALNKLVGAFLEALKKNPQHQQSSREPWPNKTQEEPWELWKMRFTMPRSSGSSSHGRLIYCVDPVQKWIKLMMIYTHAEHEGRPSDQQIRDAFKETPPSPESEPIS